MNTVQIFPTHPRVRLFAAQFQVAMIALVLMSISPLGALAQEGHSHAQQMTAEQKSDASVLIGIVRQSTERFKKVSVAKAEGYALQFGCVSGDSSGAMGLHYVNGDLVKKGALDIAHPQIVIYEPTGDGHLRLIGADYLLFKDAWDAKHTSPPQLRGQMFHLFDAPNRFGLPAFYTLHVWAWKANPNGAFVNWHPDVSCELYGGKNQ